MPVNTMARPRRSAAAITSGSRTDPPGWTTAVAPALAASSTPSGKGKNASEATTLPVSGVCAFITAIFTESTRLICPAPTPSVAPSLANTMALDFTCFATCHAKRMMCISSGVGMRLVTVRSSLSAGSPQSDGSHFEQTEVFLRRKDFLGARRESRRGDALDEQLRDFIRRRRIHFAVERQDTPVRRNRIAG